MSIKTIVVLFALSVIPLFAAESDLEKAVAFRKAEQFGKVFRQQELCPLLIRMNGKQLISHVK